MSRLDEAHALCETVEKIDRDTPLLALLSTLGAVRHTGSVENGLMVGRDLDFEIQNTSPSFADAIALVPRLVNELGAASVKVTDFSDEDDEAAAYYVGCDFLFDDERWHVDATIVRPAPPDRSTLELLAPSTDEQKETILRLKNELMQAGRYVGSQSTPPYTFRSVHVYEGVMKGGAESVAELEEYYRTK